jgi:hypothetical protein
MYPVRIAHAPVTHPWKNRAAFSLTRLRSLVWLGVAVYTIFLCAAPFEHHDFSCELKTPQHCTSCTSSVLSASPDSPAVPGEWNLVDAGTAPVADVRAESLLLAVRSTGRSPPADA